MKYPVVAENFRIALAENNMTQQKLADVSGIGKSSISHYCNGSHCPDNLRAIQLAKLLKVNPLWLMGLSDNKEEVSEISELNELFRNSPLDVQASVMTLLRAAQPHHEQTDLPEETDK